MRTFQFFELYDTYGVPLDIIFELCLERELLPDWIDFFAKAMQKNWNPWTTYGSLREAVHMVYEDDFVAEWEKRMKYCLTQILPLEIER